MKRVVTSGLLFFLLVFFAHAQETIVLEGQYHEKNLYVNNPVAKTGVGFCVYEVRVNGELSTDETNSSAFEIDLAQFEDLKPGDDVLIEVKHKPECTPKVLNPNVLKPRPTFEVVDIKVDDNGTLTWKTVNEQGRLPFTIQQFKWNKWVNVGEVQGNGAKDTSTYSFKVDPVPGENRFRVKQEGMEGDEKRSQATRFYSSAPKISYDYKKQDDKVTFSSETYYELYNKYGQIVKKGFGKTLDMSNMEEGVYYLNFGSQTVDFKKF